ncbi:MAG: potassium transporter KefB [Pedobacter sp.]|nr:MAG: potassium transporter KefB [Pedobacter sp.]
MKTTENQMNSSSSGLSATPKKAFSYVKCIRNGAIPAILLVSLFLLSADKSFPEWGPYWRLKPILIVPFAGMLGGGIFAFLDNFALNMGWSRALFIFLSGLAYLICIWLGFVLGFNGTYWN